MKRIDNLQGLYSKVCEDYGNENCKETVDAVKTAIMDIEFDGVEPEFASDEALEWWDNLSFVPYTGTMRGSSYRSYRFEKNPPKEVFLPGGLVSMNLWHRDLHKDLD